MQCFHFCFITISIHALRKESDLSIRRGTAAPLRFQSTLSVRRATMTILQHEIAGLFQSTLSVRRATVTFVLPFLPFRISIHALRKESDS